MDITYQLSDQQGIQRSMSQPGTPFDNAPSERVFRIFRAEWMKTSTVI